ncbi:MAG: MFS transporter [Chloroflexota bacterium]|nr:MFS transporter [Chloroflexota bacterium]
MAQPPAASANRTSPRGWTVLLLNRLHYSTVVLASFGFGLFLPFLQADLGLSYLQIGLLQAVAWGTSAVCLVPFSVLFARFNPNYRVLVGLALMTPFLFTQGLAQGFWTLLASRFLMVLTQAGMTPARPLLLRWWAAPRQYSTVTAVGLSLHSAFMAAALTFSPIIIVVLNSWRLAYFLQAGLLGIHLLAWAALIRKAPRSLEESADAVVAGDDRADTDEQIDRDQRTSTLVGALIRYPHAWLLGVVMLCLSASWTTVLTFLPIILETERGVAISAGSILFGFLYYVLVPGGMFGSWIFNHITNRRVMVMLPALLNLLSTLGALLAGNEFLAAVALTGMGMAWVFVPAMEILPFEFRDIRTREVSVIAGLVQTFGAIGFGGGPVLAGAIAQSANSLVAGVLVVGALTGLAVLAAAALPRRFEGRLV